METLKVSETSATVTTSGNSPWFSGHFPNNPILPGIAQLKMVVDLIRESTKQGVCLTSLSRVKFRKIVRPEEQLALQITAETKEGSYLFKITSGNEDVCSGKIHFTQNTKSTNS
jgi:3-hydroxymyristoyl/3-hydroxydecanoyl-(acyl carrier protein) dehydratase